MLKQEPSFGGQRGTIVNTASIAGNCIIPTTAAYGASKHAVVALTRCDALRHSKDSIRINCVSPGAVWTPMVSEAGLPQQFIDMGAAQSPMKRYVESKEAAEAILFLASPQASAITGVNLPVDCGTQLLRSL
jgi:NAD(P)-dependent dehydrogenase (short-subunit alcohol dehydrogenase family)